MNRIRMYQALSVLYQHLDPLAHEHITVQGSKVKEAASAYVALHPDVAPREVRLLIKETDVLLRGALQLQRRARKAFGVEAGLPGPTDKMLPFKRRQLLEQLFVKYQEQCPEEVQAAGQHKQQLEHLAQFWHHVLLQLKG